MYGDNGLLHSVKPLPTIPTLPTTNSPRTFTPSTPASHAGGAAAAAAAAVALSLPQTTMGSSVVMADNSNDIYGIDNLFNDHVFDSNGEEVDQTPVS